MVETFRRRRRLMVRRSVALLGMIQLLVASTILWRSHVTGAFGGDFLAYDTAAHLVRAIGWNHLYELAAQETVQSRLLPDGQSLTGTLQVIPFDYPPPAVLLFLPFARLSEQYGALLWVVMNAALAMLSSLLLLYAPWSVSPADSSDGRIDGQITGEPERGRPLLTVQPIGTEAILDACCTFGFLPLAWGLLAGQPVGIVLSLSSQIFLGVTMEQDLRAGLALALLAALKPQLALGPFLLLVIARRHGALVVFLTISVFLVGISLRLVGVDGLASYARLLTQMDSFRGDQQLAVNVVSMPNWRALIVRWDGVPAMVGYILTAALDIATLCTALIVLRRRPDTPADLATTYLGLSAAAILVSYHSQYHDLALLLVPSWALYRLYGRSRQTDPRATIKAGVAIGRGGAPRSPARTTHVLVWLAVISASVLLGVPSVTWWVLGLLAIGWLHLWTALAIPGLFLLLIAAGRATSVTACRPFDG